MAETIAFACGEVKPAGTAESHLSLTMRQGGKITPVMTLSQLSKRAMANQSDRMTDLLEIAAYVYLADQAVGRGGDTLYQMAASWRRRMQLRISVRDLDFWSDPRVQNLIENCVSYLSGDVVKFIFEKKTYQPAVNAFLALDAEDINNGFMPERVLLFSGGLDSLAGAADALLQDRKKVMLVSHRSAPLIQGVQTELASRLSALAGSGRLWHAGLSIDRRGMVAKEFTQRTRAFLFVALGASVARMFNLDRLDFCENGVVSVNLPLADHIVGTRATRTTHPAVMTKLNRLLSQAAGCDFQIRNPLFWDNKADVVRRIVRHGCADLIDTSFSCAEVRQSSMRGKTQCGCCTQCLDRRFGILAAGAGHHERDAQYEVELLRGPRMRSEDRVLAKAFVMAAHRYATQDVRQFSATHSEVLRALPHLGLPPAEALARIHDLHQRHGNNVVAVLKEAVGQLNPITESLTVAEGSLLSMVRGSQAQDILLSKRIAAVGAERPTPDIISFMFRQKPDYVAFDEGPVLRGASAELLVAIVAATSGANASREFIKRSTLATELRLDLESFNKRLVRLRKQLREDFRSGAGRTLSADDIIEGSSASGLRLSSRVRFRAFPSGA